MSLSDLEIGELLGRDRFGSFYRAVHRGTGVVFGLKELFLPAPHSGARAAFGWTVEDLAAVSHPALLGIRGYAGLAPGDSESPAILTEFAARGSLAGLLSSVRAGRPPPEWDDSRKLILLYGVAAAAGFLHGRGRAHGDIAPDSVLLTESVEPLLANFGFPGVIGRPLFPPPEDPRAGDAALSVDAFAFAMLAFTVLTGLVPFGGDFAAKVRQGDRPPIPDSIPIAQRQLIAACWAQEPDDRPAFAQIAERLMAAFPDAAADDDFRLYRRRICAPALEPLLQAADCPYCVHDLKFLTCDVNRSVPLSKRFADRCVGIAHELGYASATACPILFLRGGTDAAEAAKVGIEATTLLGIAFAAKDAHGRQMVYHTPRDTTAAIEPEVVEATPRIFMRFVDEVDAGRFP